MLFEQLFLNIKIYLGYIHNNIFPPRVTEEEEEKYIMQLMDKKTHDEARNILIERNLRLVAHIAKKYENMDELNEDIISIGIIGLIKAIDTFSLEKSLKLATYAARCIENEILMVIRLNKKAPYTVSLLDTIGSDKDGSEITIQDVYPSDDEDIKNYLNKQYDIKKLKQYFEVLDDREMQILTLRYGLNNSNELTQQEIADTYNISRSYVSRIEKRALIKLLQEFKKHCKK